LVLSSQRVSSDKVIRAGFVFDFPEISSALTDLLGASRWQFDIDSWIGPRFALYRIKLFHPMSEDLNQTGAPQEPETENNEQSAAAPKSEKKSKKDKQAELEQALADEKDKFLRLFAEFENYKKRTVKERMDLFKTAGQEVITALLPVVDDFERALKEIAKSEEKELFVGVELISQKLTQVLQSKGLALVEVVTGADFDADIHEAITQIPAPDPSLKGKVVDVVEKGYKLGDRMIRHPKVVVGQ